MYDNIVSIKQIDAQYCLAENPIAKKMAIESLSYTGKVMIYDRSRGYPVLKFIKKTLAETHKDKRTYFSSGLLNYVIDYSNEHEHPCDVEIVDPYTIKKKLIPKLPGIDFETFQKKMLRRIGIDKRGILVGPTAMGKSVVLGGIINKLNCPETIMIVPTRTILNQLHESFCKWFGKDKVGFIGQGINDQRQITVCLFQSIDKYKVNKNLKLVCMDEVHLINNTIINFLTKCNHVYYRYGVTATPQKQESNFVKAMEMMGSFGPIICTVEDLEAEKRVLPVKVKLVSYFCSNPIGYSYHDSLRKDVLMSKVRNTKLLKAAKSEALDKGKTCLILIDETKQGNIMVDIAKQIKMKVTFVHGKIDNEIIKKVIKDLNDRRIKCVIATKVFGVGTNIPNVDCVVMGSSRKSEIDTLQKVGRGRRRVEGKDYLTVIDSIDKVTGSKRFYNKFQSHSIERINTYEEKKWEITKLTF
jgi:superfamily II DNA or RNA helicase